MGDESTAEYREERRRALGLGRTLRDRGVESAASHADREYGEWRLAAHHLALDWIRERGQRPFFLHEMRAYCEERGLRAAPDPRAWGAIVMKLCRAGVIVSAGYAPSTDPKQHLRPSALWRASGRSA